jgi:hypothetical protein
MPGEKNFHVNQPLPTPSDSKDFATSVRSKRYFNAKFGGGRTDVSAPTDPREAYVDNVAASAGRGISEPWWALSFF